MNEEIKSENIETKEKKVVFVPDVVSVGDFAERLGLPVSSVIAELLKNGVLATINENIDFETAEIIGDYLGFEVKEEKTEEKVKKPEPGIKKEKTSKNQKERPPVITVMGHVDHGKTSLLDSIRETNVVAGESGGITQHIGAYQVEKNGKKITFLDTPGHEAFSKMRAHGAQVTDIALIVVAADDGIKPQTLEAIDLAKEAKVSIIIVITKIDKPEANIDRVKKQLAEIGLNPEDWGGHTLMGAVSSKTKEGIDDLLELILLLAEMKKLKADPNDSASGVVIESHLDYGRGPTATILVQNGTLLSGDWVCVGETYGKIRSMEDASGKKIKKAAPSTPIKVSGLKSVPKVAETFQAYLDEKSAKEECQKILKGQHVKRLSEVKKIGIEEITASVKAGKIKELNIVLKADVKGSLEAVEESLEKMKTEEVAVKIIKKGVGDITEDDVMMAKAGGALIFGFGVGLSSAVDQLAKREKVKIALYEVIYELLDDVRAALSTLLTPEKIELVEGKLEVLKIFKAGKPIILGGKVIEGKILPHLNVRIIRNKETLGEGRIVSLKRDKSEVPEAPVGAECGLGIETDVTPAEKDIIEAYRVEERKRTL